MDKYYVNRIIQVAVNIKWDDLRATRGLGIVVVQDNTVVGESLEVGGDDIGVVPTDMVETYNNDRWLHSVKSANF